MCSGPYACVDPSALENAPSANPSFVPSIMPTIMPSVMPTFIPTITPLPALTQFCRANLDCDPSSWCGDGWCDVSLNNEACGWDGGDCCEQTCVKDEDTDFDCDMSGFLCIDPAHAVGIELPDGCDVEIPLWIGDGICDQFGNYNTLACGYDGGDCCPDTCVGVDDGLCSYFVCIRDLPDGCDVFEPAWLGYVSIDDIDRQVYFPASSHQFWPIEMDTATPTHRSMRTHANGILVIVVPILAPLRISQFAALRLPTFVSTQTVHSRSFNLRPNYHPTATLAFQGGWAMDIVTAGLTMWQSVIGTLAIAVLRPAKL